VGFGVKDSTAGQMCWSVNASPLKVSVTDTGSGHKLVNGFWDAAADRIPVTGTFEKASTGTDRILTLHGVWSTTIPSLDDCLFHVTLSSTSSPKWQGSGSYFCSRMAAPASATLTRTNCSAVAESVRTTVNGNNADPNTP
jgi:hypothetical protein